jgi:hypothetical protein
MFVLEGATPNAPVVWVLTGHGSLTGTSTITNEHGVATAVYRATAGTPGVDGDSITVEALVYGT